MMKYIRNMAVAVSCVAGMAACQQEEAMPQYDAGERILFGMPQLSVESGSRSMLKDALEAGDEFGVLGYCVPYKVIAETTLSELDYDMGGVEWSTKKNQCPPEVFYKQKVSVGENGCTYDKNNGDGNDPKYWYRDGKDLNGNDNSAITGTDAYQYTFFAYYPYEGAFTVTEPSDASKAGAPVFRFTMPQPQGSVLDHTRTQDAMLGVLSQSRDDGNLQFYFSHVLTALGFEVNNFSPTDLIVHSVKLKGTFFKSIDINFKGTTVAYQVTDERYSGEYVLFDEDVEGKALTLNAPPEGSTVTSTNGPINDVYLLLISGNAPYFGEGVNVEIIYTFDGKTRAIYSTGRPTSFTPRPGVKYTAQLNFVGNAFVLQFEDSGMWEDGEMADGDGTNDDILFE